MNRQRPFTRGASAFIGPAAVSSVNQPSAYALYRYFNTSQTMKHAKKMELSLNFIFKLPFTRKCFRFLWLTVKLVERPEGATSFAHQPGPVFILRPFPAYSTHHLKICEKGTFFRVFNLFIKSMPTYQHRPTFNLLSTSYLKTFRKAFNMEKVRCNFSSLEKIFSLQTCTDT